MKPSLPSQLPVTNDTWISGPVGRLQLLYSEPSDATKITAVMIIAHPHPQFGGTMTNKVVHTLAKAANVMQMATVRFNFRGVGESEGEYDHGVGEIDDMQAVAVWAKQRYGSAQLIFAGFSFGAYIAWQLAARFSCMQLIMVAPAVEHFNFSVVTKPSCPVDVLMGNQDEVVPFALVEQFCLQHQFKLHIFNEVGHYFHGQLLLLQQTIEEVICTHHA